MDNLPLLESDMDPTLRSDRNDELARILQSAPSDGLTALPGGHERLAALALHALDNSAASGGRENLSMEQTLEDQQQQQQQARHAASDLLSFAGESGGPGGSGFGGADFHPFDNYDGGAGGDGGGNGGFMDDSLNGALFLPAGDHQMGGGGHHDDDGHGGVDMGMEQSGVEGYEDDVGEKQSKKRKRKQPQGEDDIKAKKDIHKEVERRRRAMINEGIQGIVDLLPPQTADVKQKGQILQQAAGYIKQLQEDGKKKVEEMAMEKLVYDQEIMELKNQLHAVQARYDAEHANCNRFEQSYREAHDRCQKLERELEGHRGGGKSVGTAF